MKALQAAHSTRVQYTMELVYSKLLSSFQRRERRLEVSYSQDTKDYTLGDSSQVRSGPTIATARLLSRTLHRVHLYIPLHIYTFSITTLFNVMD